MKAFTRRGLLAKLSSFGRPGQRPAQIREDLCNCAVRFADHIR
jgi:hypothetical protein